MLIGIIGDVHYGASLIHGTKDITTGINSRLLDYQNTLRYAMDCIHQSGCKNLVFTGDIFESRTPTIKQQQLFASDLYYATNKLGFDTIHIVLGNHDYQRSNHTHTLSYLQELNLPNIIVISDVATEKFAKKGGKISFLPYRDRNFYKGSVEDALDRIRLELDDQSAKRPDILIGHMMVEGTIPAQDYYAELFGANELSLPKKLFDKFSKTVMGHIHEPGFLTPKISYTGSLEKRSATETENKLAFVYDTVTQKTQEIILPCKSINKHEVIFNQPGNYYCIDRKFDKNAIVELTFIGSDRELSSLNQKDLEKSLKESDGVSCLLPLKMIPVRSALQRTAAIRQHASPKQALSDYLLTSIDDQDMAKKLADIGQSILDEVSHG